jgi:spermidine synthase
MSKPTGLYAATQIAGYPEISISEFIGVRSLHLSSDAIQGSMRLAMPDQIELEYVQQMMMWLLFNKTPQHRPAGTRCCCTD